MRQTGDIHWVHAPRAALDIAWSDRADGIVFERFFAGYDRAFVLPDEKEGVDGFVDCLALNHPPAHDDLVARYGAFREYCLIAKDAHGPAGGANFIVFHDGGAVVTANLNYCYVEPDARGRGHLRRLVAAIGHVIAADFDYAGQPLIFLEQNDPLAMSEDAYARDSAFTGLDQVDRLRIWTKLGARLVDFAYVQPPLSAKHDPETGLAFAVIGADENTIPACLLRDHLERFFAISVLKGEPVASEPNAAAQIAELDRMCRDGLLVALHDPAQLIARAPTRAAMLALLRDGAKPSLRALLAGNR